MSAPSLPARGFPVLPTLLLLFLGTIWGFGFSLAKVGVTGGLSPYPYAFWQFFGAGLVLLAITAARGQLPPVDAWHLRFYAIAGLFNIAVPNVVALVAVQHIPAGVMVLLVTLAPLLTYAISQTFSLERFEPRRAAGILLGFCGTLMILLPRASLPSPEMAGWVLFAILTPAFYGASNVYSAWDRPPVTPSLALAAGMQMTAGLAMLPVLAVTGTFHVPFPPLSAAEAANLAHAAVACMGSLIFFEIIRMTGAVFVSQVGYIVCLTGVFWGKLFFGESHSAWVWGAVATILAGVALVTWPRAGKP